MTNNKNLFIFFIIISAIFLLLFVFPSVNSKITIQFYNIKYLIYKPIEGIEKKIANYWDVISINDNNLLEISKLKAELNRLKVVNSNLIITLSKFNELNEILFSQPEGLPKSIGVKIIGNKKHLIEDNFIINKGYDSGISIGDYLINLNYVIGKVKEVNLSSSKVVSVFNRDYGEEVIIGKKSFIVSGTNDDHLIFIRQKNSTEVMNLAIGDVVKIKINNFYAELGTVELLNYNYIIKPNITDSFLAARVIIND